VSKAIVELIYVELRDADQVWDGTLHSDAGSDAWVWASEFYFSGEVYVIGMRLGSRDRGVIF
jgi:hypothetical protein